MGAPFASRLGTTISAIDHLAIQTCTSLSRSCRQGRVPATTSRLSASVIRYYPPILAPRFLATSAAAGSTLVVANGLLPSTPPPSSATAAAAIPATTTTTTIQQASTDIVEEETSSPPPPTSKPPRTAPAPTTLSASDQLFVQTSRKLVGRVIRAGTMAQTVAVSTNRLRWHNFLQKHYTKPSRALVHDPQETLVEGDVIQYSLVPPEQRLARLKRGRGKNVKYEVRSVVTPFGTPLDQRVVKKKKREIVKSPVVPASTSTSTSSVSSNSDSSSNSGSNSGSSKSGRSAGSRARK